MCVYMFKVLFAIIYIFQVKRFLYFLFFIFLYENKIDKDKKLKQKLDYEERKKWKRPEPMINFILLGRYGVLILFCSKLYVQLEFVLLS